MGFVLLARDVGCDLDIDIFGVEIALEGCGAARDGGDGGIVAWEEGGRGSVAGGSDAFSILENERVLE